MIQHRHDIRRQNLRHIIEVLHDGNATSLAKDIQNYLTLTGKDKKFPASAIHRVFYSKDQGGRNLGDKTARLVERACKLPGYSMDSPKFSLTTETGAASHAIAPLAELISDRESDILDSEFVGIPKLVLDDDKFSSSDTKIIIYASGRELRKAGFTSFDLVHFEMPDAALEPLIGRGDTLTVDRGQVDISSGNLYALIYKKRLSVRRLYLTNGLVVLHGDNQDDARWKFDVEVETEDIKIIGRIISRTGSNGL